MSFPANAIGIGSAALAGVYYGSKQGATLTGMDWWVIGLLAIIAIIFGLIFS